MIDKLNEKKVIVDWYDKHDNNNGFIYGIEHQDENENVIDIEWFKSEIERDKKVKNNDWQIKSNTVHFKRYWKYLFGIIKNEWMKDHPHFAYNQKQVLQDIIINLKNKQNELSKLIDELRETE